MSVAQTLILLFSCLVDPAALCPAFSVNVVQESRHQDLAVRPNKDETVLWIRQSADKAWRNVGEGKGHVRNFVVAASLLPPKLPYQWKAQAPGYNEISGKILNPAPRLDIVFMKGDRIEFADEIPTAVRGDELPQAIAGPIKQRFAVVIGVSSQHDDMGFTTLEYADDDARAMHAWLTAPEGGGFAQDNVKLLLNEKATREAIMYELCTGLYGAIADDLVFIYFAGHGTVEKDRPDNYYLVPHDGISGRIASTCVSMWDIKEALRRCIEAGRVVILVDACHSGAIGAEFVERAGNRGSADEAARLNSEISKDAPRGVFVLTSAQPGRAARESSEWGDGHGLFTWVLLQALGGEADTNGDGVSLGELSSYVSEHVRRASKNAQSPLTSGSYDPSVVISARSRSRHAPPEKE